MKYSIRPFLVDESGIYGILFDEIMSLSLDSISEVIEDMENVFSGKYNMSSFSGNLAIVDFDNTIAKINHFDELIGEEPVVDIYNMLVSYHKILIECKKLE
jgi:hypothetical protein